MRIVSICPSNTELLAYLNATDQLVGIDNYSDWPSSIYPLPRVGPDLSIDMEKVVQLKPDLVLASLSVPGMEKNIDQLKALGLNYIIFNPSTLEDIGQDLLTLGKLINKEQEAQQISGKMRRLIEDFKTKYGTVKKMPSIYWEWWPKPVYTPGKYNWLTEMSNLLGAVNCFANEPKESVQTTWDDVLNRNPDLIIMVWVGVSPSKVRKEFVLKRDGVERLNAFKTNQIHVLPEPYFCRPSPRLFIGLRLLEQLLYPETELDGPLKDPLLDETK